MTHEQAVLRRGKGLLRMAGKQHRRRGFDGMPRVRCYYNTGICRGVFNNNVDWSAAVPMINGHGYALFAFFVVVYAISPRTVNASHKNYDKF